MRLWLKTLWFPLLAACLSFGLLQVEGVERSFLGAPDREMLLAAFKLRDGVARGSGDPVLWLDLDYDTLVAHAKSKGRPSPISSLDGARPSAIMPREILASALAYASSPSATLVVLDVDVSWAGPDPEGEALLAAQLEAWSANPNAPLLVLAREVLQLPDGPTLMPSPLDAIVATAPNIVYGGIATLSGNGGVREFVASQCYITPDRKAHSLPSVVTFAQVAQEANRADGALPNQSRAASIKAKVAAQTLYSVASCHPKPKANSQNGIISWHIGYSYSGIVKAAPVSSKWPHQSACQLSSPPLSGARISFADILPNPKGVDTAPLCGAIVIIGGDNEITKDRSATPIGTLPGPIILANAMRGHFDTGPIFWQNWSLLRIGLQIMLLLSTVICIVWAFDEVGKIRKRLLLQTRPNFAMRIKLFMSHPLCFKFIVAFVTFGVGVVLTAISLELGFWGLLSAPAYLATLYEAWRQINADKEAV